MVRHVHLGEQSARARVDRLRGAHHLALEFLTGILSELQKSAEPCANGWCVRFRHADIQANGIGLRQNKELLRSATIAVVDYLPRIHAPLGDDAPESPINLL